MTEKHPIRPWLPPEARLLMCGTFPPPLYRFSMHFFYPNYINDMWRIFGLILLGDKEAYVDAPGHTFRRNAIEQMLSTLAIAMSDTGREARRLADNASDKFLEIVQPIDLAATLSQIPRCTAIATTGEKAASVIASLTGTKAPATGSYTTIPPLSIEGVDRELHHWRMPSSSRAYPLALHKKARAYAQMLFQEGILPSASFPAAKIPANT